MSWVTDLTGSVPPLSPRHRKRQHANHVTGRQGVDLVKNHLPRRRAHALDIAGKACLAFPPASSHSRAAAYGFSRPAKSCVSKLLPRERRPHKGAGRRGQRFEGDVLNEGRTVPPLRRAAPHPVRRVRSAGRARSLRRRLGFAACRGYRCGRCADTRKQPQFHGLEVHRSFGSPAPPHRSLGPD